MSRAHQSSGYFDIQVNGYAGVDFNSENLTAEGLRLACEALRRDGVAGALATVITDDVPRMVRQLRRIVALRAADELVADVIWGLHVEGPFISPDRGYAGAHPCDAARSAEPLVMERLLEAGGGLVKLVTLAPEVDTSCGVIRMLHEAGIVVAAGHTNATLVQLEAAVDAGLRLFTHLGNGCPMTLDRHDNIVQRALSVARRRPLWVSFVADGAHVPFPTLANYLQLIPPQRVIIVSDAIAAAGLGPGRYTLGRQVLHIGEDLVPRAADHSHLVGSATPLKQMADNLRKQLGLSPQQIAMMTQSNPRRLLNIDCPDSVTPAILPPDDVAQDSEASVLRTPRP
ncbi:MAG: hypothetical protein WD294_03495 [Phycisphaeraceae bacterium]